MKKLMTIVVFVTGCINAPPFVCTEDAQCNSNPPGICVKYDKLQGSCAVPDTSCPSQYRYHVSAQPDQINKCATIPQFEIGTVPTKIDEHKDFAFHVVVRDNAGQKLLNYGGTPVVTTNWGDARTISSTPFVAGEADFSVSLNRETNDKDGPAYVVLQDGAAKGRSSPISVVPPGWQMESTVKLSGGIKLSGTMSLVTENDKFALVAAGQANSGTVAVNDFYFAAPDMLSKLQISEPPFFIAPRNDLASPVTSSLLVDDGRYLLTYTMAPIESGGPVWLLYSSSNGIKWNAVGDSIFKVSSSLPDHACELIVAPQLLREGPGHYRVFYNSQQKDHEGVSCSAESHDSGETWSNAQLLSWTGAALTFAIIAKEGTVYKAWTREGAYATSGDGIVWVESKSENGRPIASAVYQPSAGRYYGIFGSGSTDIQILVRL